MGVNCGRVSFDCDFYGVCNELKFPKQNETENEEREKRERERKKEKREKREIGASEHKKFKQID